MRIQFYNLTNAPSETTDVAARYADVVERRAHLMRERHAPSTTFPPPAIDREPTQEPVK